MSLPIQGKLMKKCSKCVIVKMKTDFYFRNNNRKYRSECIQCRSIKQKEWIHIIHEQIENPKDNIVMKIEKNCVISRKNKMMRIAMRSLLNKLNMKKQNKNRC